MNEMEFQPSRGAFVEQLHLGDGVPTILAGDFNNGDDHLEVAFPELFEDNVLTTAVKFDEKQFDEYYVGGQYQLDHVLYTSKDFTLQSSQVVRDPSDHREIVVELQFRS